MNALVSAFGPSFAAAMALQQLNELIKPLLAGLKDRRPLVIRSLSLVLGLLLSFAGGLRVLAHFGYAGPMPVDALVTGFIIGGGTEGFNSVLKFLGYAKEQKKRMPKTT